MAYDTRGFCWTGIVSTDPAKAISFYPEVLGWTVEHMDMGGDQIPMFAAAGVNHAHLTPPQMDGEPSHWNQYLRVDDVDASTKAAKKNGGTVVVDPKNIPPGRFSVVTSPSGAHVTLFKEADPSAQNAPKGNGSIAWVELWSKDVDADLAWLKKTFGYTVDTMKMPDGPYHILKHGGEQRGGVMQSNQPEAPAMWLAWVAVDDVDQTVVRATSHGGNTIAPAFDVPGIGRLAILSDPTGGVFGVMKPAEQ